MVPAPMSNSVTLQRRKIDAVKKQLDDPAIGLPRAVWFFAALAGTGDHLHYVIRHRLQRRLDRLCREPPSNW